MTRYGLPKSALSNAGTIHLHLELSRQVSVITHIHPEGIKCAAATSVAIWLAR